MMLLFYSMQKKFGRALFGYIVLFSVIFLSYISASAAVTLDISTGSIAITSTGYSISNAPEIPNTDAYEIIGSSTKNTVSVNSGSHSITINNLNISIPVTTATDMTSAEKVCAFAIYSGVNVNLELSGANTLVSAAGCAGIYVAPGASLKIDGSGSLAATGGRNSNGTPKTCAGAGIGGNGSNANFNNVNSTYFGYGDFGTGNFGTITIDGGDITATGGNTHNISYGGGAGIGGGGMNGAWTDTMEGLGKYSSGTIVINGGTINSYSGKGLSGSLTDGGSAIGTGAIGGSPIKCYTVNVSIEIHGGTISATAYNDGAGIGSGTNNANCPTILIDGNANVTAQGGDEANGSAWGGAGIGAGDNGNAHSIEIAGNAVVSAAGGGAAAGIGGGQEGAMELYSYPGTFASSGNISIRDNAIVTAKGGPCMGSFGSGAGIGSGRSYYYDNTCGTISILDSANVTAYAGKSSNALGIGANYAYNAGDVNAIVIDDTVTLNLFNKDATFSAIYSHSPGTVTGTGAQHIVSYTMPTGGAFPGPSTMTATTSADSYEWEYSGSSGNFPLSIYDGSTPKYSVTSAHTAFGNWAVLLAPPPTYTVTYDANGGTGTMTDPSSPYLSGAPVTVMQNTFANAGSTFAGFVIQGESGTVYANPADAISGASASFTIGTSPIVLVAQWNQIQYYTLTVVNGSGSGSYEANETVAISANTAPAGQVFSHWSTSGGGSIADANSPNTSFTMPASNVTLTANYVPNTPTVTSNPVLTVIRGSGSGAYPAGTIVSITADQAPSGMVFDHWESADGIVFADKDRQFTTIVMPAGNATVYAVYRNIGGGGTVVNPGPGSPTDPVGPVQFYPVPSPTSPSTAYIYGVKVYESTSDEDINVPATQQSPISALVILSVTFACSIFIWFKRKHMK